MSKEVLVVEDHEPSRFIMEMALAEKGFKVTTAQDLETAIEAISNSSFGILITDTELGEKGNTDGLKVAEAFKEMNPEGIIIGVSSEQDNEKLWNGYSDAFIKKASLVTDISKGKLDLLGIPSAK